MLRKHFSKQVKGVSANFNREETRAAVTDAISMLHLPGMKDRCEYAVG